ncbi:MAG: hypothetical protein QOK49_1978 [Baekduia sp.]|nr:hypothetical protein [Baekduia sp.]
MLLQAAVNDPFGKGDAALVRAAVAPGAGGGV